jgi:hypothetical protein
VDIGDKSWGVNVCQKYFEKQSQNSGTAGGSSKLQFGPENTLHEGDQFLSAGANDFRARQVATTAWIASPEETVYVFICLLPPAPPLPHNTHTHTHIYTYHHHHHHPLLPSGLVELGKTHITIPSLFCNSKHHSPRAHVSGRLLELTMHCLQRAP